MLSAPHPFSFILFGASGNLAKLKIYPALYTLALKDRLPKDYAIVGYARTEMDEKEFRALVEESVRTDMIEVKEDVLKDFLSHVHYHSGQYDESKDYGALGRTLDGLEKGWKDPVRLAYLSIPPTAFESVIKNLNAGGVHKKGQGFRIIVEKPVGSNLKTFEEIKATLAEDFAENEIYLLDHYLGKDAFRNIYYLRFANPILERLLKNTLIHHVEIAASETLGLEGRAGYFEHTGTLRDMFQSHLVLMTSLLTMRLRDDEQNFRDSRCSALEQIYLPPAADLSDVILQGQYTAGKIGREHVVGYTEEEEISKDSRTNTFIALKLMTRTSRWEGVPFYLKSGKRLDKKETRISIQFQVPHAVGKGSSPNRLDIIIQGEAGMKLYLQTKIGGTEPEFRPLVMEDPLVCFGDCLPEHALLLLEAIHGKQQWFLTFNEVRAAWRLIDPLQAYIAKSDTPLYHYAAGSKGPKEAEDWIGRDDTRWF
ncbi:MAG TPA: glucose-6-phosphate dehydrogenase [Candidatus Peribacteraceae bacterium]|nr:glucose-6-phosphate dehydrogenase [Candidatus Peribacteraceae bacterium]